jgi:hypothetical protein
LCARLATTGTSGSGCGRQRWSFFLQAEALDDALDAARADGQAALAELLGDDLGGGLGVEEAMANRLANGLLRTAVVARGPRRVVDEGGGASAGEGIAELEVALLAVAEGLGGRDGAQAQALAGQEHGELAGDVVVGRERQGAGGAQQLALLAVGVKHGGTPAAG